MKSYTSHQNELKYLFQTGDRFYSIGQLETALKNFQRALEITRLINNQETRLNIVYRIGLVHRKIGEYSNALKYLELALELAKTIGNEAKIATIYNEKGEIYYLLKEYTTALKCYSQALIIFNKFKDIVGIGKTINHISTIYNLTELSTQSLEYSRKSLNIFQKLAQSAKNDKLTIKINESIALHNMGEAYFLISRPRQAQAFLELALEIRQKLWEDSLDRLALTIDNIPKIEKNHYSSYVYPQKMATYEQKEKDGFRRSIFAEYGKDLVKTLDLIEKVYKNLGLERQANNYHQQRIEISEKINSNSWLVTT
ncbi:MULTISPECIES: tetratricopeptide repeat protein [Okeania]|uniref:Tetratricopeptide repeat protein n=1 Tax=Okeania hirsuta TaxID=1458930 RepID=A0A3N6PCQ5_9CYAN|nr:MULTISPECIES: tetratricopeptide repeat protein [Okeania]NEP07334.1 tetratricopeptide repeat protein [Okeania sp. SIO4D6]NET11785.1 tetratricopeptide repeat protein [Okeania sp. SIO1H6]NEP74758.1 tetratricopeptide repeat protein [Okeania sp. SIO2G5]NEP95783.1 tetratricopeptide repeat protein [Okeania sp. SIO2F5]NEQ93561.1 tetratricopeptide repeat protein [Okeania sp. SIO2G4]